MRLFKTPIPPKDESIVVTMMSGSRLYLRVSESVRGLLYQAVRERREGIIKFNGQDGCGVWLTPARVESIVEGRR